MKAYSRGNSIEEKIEGWEENDPPNEENKNASIHWISCVVVEATNHQECWCIKRGGRASTNRGEAPDGPRITYAPEDEKRD